MNQQRANRMRKGSAALVLLLLAALILPVLAPTAEAGKEGVFLNDSVYFTLEDVRLSPGADMQTLFFSLELVNGSDEYIDYNGYGAAVLDGAGQRYSAELAEKISSRVKPGTSQRIKLMSKLPLGITLEELRTQIFMWDFSSPEYMQPLGELSAAAAVPASQTGKPQAVLRLAEADSSYASDAWAAFQPEQSYTVLNGGVWNVYVHLAVENVSSGSFKLPSALLYHLKDENGLSYSGTVVSGADSFILPHQSEHVVLRFPVGDLAETDRLTLAFSVKTAASASAGAGTGAGASGNGSSGSSSVSSSELVLGSLDLAGDSGTAAISEARPVPGRPAGLQYTLNSVSAAAKSDGVHVESELTLANAGPSAAAVPSGSAFYQLTGSALSVDAEDSLSHPEYLAPGETTVYRYKALLPSGVDTSLVQLAVQENKGRGTAEVQVPVYLAALPASGGDGSVKVSGEGDAYITSAGKLALSVKSSYRLLSDGSDDTLLTELQVENLESHAVALPDLYVKYADGEVEVSGKAVRIQSSPYLNPGQKTTLYLYAAVPYHLAMNGGDLYVGEGEMDPKTKELTLTREWAKLAFTVSNASIPTVGTGMDWLIPDIGRLSTVRIVDSKVYDTDNGGKLQAVFIASQNQESRVTSAVPFAGYFLGQDQSVWAANATEDTGRAGRGSWSLSTLWTELPKGQPLLSSLVFGHKLEGQVFAGPHQYVLSAKTDPVSDVTIGSGAAFTANLLPYRLTFSNLTATGKDYSYIFSFTYHLDQDLALTEGSSRNRGLYITLEDDEGSELKEWEVPLSGTGSWTSGETVELTLEKRSLAQLMTLLKHAKFTVYEKFEGATRLLGTISTE